MFVESCVWAQMLMSGAEKYLRERICRATCWGLVKVELQTGHCGWGAGQVHIVSGGALADGEEERTHLVVPCHG